MSNGYGPQLGSGIGGKDFGEISTVGIKTDRDKIKLQKAAAKKAIEKSNTATAEQKPWEGSNLQKGIQSFLAGHMAAQKAKALENEARTAESRSVVADTLRLSEQSARARGESLGSLSSAMQGFFR